MQRRVWYARMFRCRHRNISFGKSYGAPPKNRLGPKTKKWASRRTLLLPARADGTGVYPCARLCARVGVYACSPRAPARAHAAHPRRAPRCACIGEHTYCCAYACMCVCAPVRAWRCRQAVTYISIQPNGQVTDKYQASIFPKTPTSNSCLKSTLCVNLKQKHALTIDKAEKLDIVI